MQSSFLNETNEAVSKIMELTESVGNAKEDETPKVESSDPPDWVKVSNAKTLGQPITESFDVEEIIKELIDTSWGGSNDSQAKAIQLLKGLAFSDDPKANNFMKALDKATSDMKLEEEVAAE